MTPRLTHKPFHALRERCDKKAVIVRRDEKQVSWSDDELMSDCDDATVFAEAMADVQPVNRNKTTAPSVGSRRSPYKKRSDREEGLAALAALVEEGRGFVVSQTPEYMEGVGRDVPRIMTRRLHRGDFAIQDSVDLHGLTVDEAETAFDDFLKRAIREGKKGVLVIHGRGKSSPIYPVLKNKVAEWLNRSEWKYQIIAYASARSCDGGAGATYVLLRGNAGQKRSRPGT